MRWHIGPLPSTALETLILLTLALYAATLFRHRRPFPKRTFLDLGIAVFLVAGLVGILVAPDHRGALGIFRAYLLEPIAMFYVAVAVIDSVDRAESFLSVWGVGVVTFGFVEIFYFGRGVLSGTLVPGNAAAAFFIDANGVALYLEPLIGLASGFALFGTSRRRWAAIATLAVIVPAEIATLSRAGLLSLAILLLIALLTLRSTLARAAIGIIAIGGAVLIRVLPVVGSRAASALSPESPTLFARVSIWILTLRMFRDHPVFGAGINAYQSTMKPYMAADPQLSPEVYPHNIFLTTWTELGLLGLAAFAFILGNLVVRPWRAFSQAGPRQRPLIWGLGAAFALFTVHGLVDSPYWKNDLSLEFWMLAALEVMALAAIRAGKIDAG